MQKEYEHWLSAFAALTINVLFFWFLFRTGSNGDVASIEVTGRTQLVFITAPRQVAAPTLPTVQKKTMPPKGRGNRSTSTKVVASIEAQNARLGEGNKPTSTQIGSSAPLNLGLPSERITFAQNALERPAHPDSLDGKPRLHVRIVDNTLAGRLQRWQKRMDCADLRRALLKEPSSAETILATMRERGCKT